MSKLWVVLAVLVAGMAGYLVIEMREWKKKKNNAVDAE